MTAAARKRQFAKMERDIVYARRGKKNAAIQRIRTERLADLRAVADRTRPGYQVPETAQPDLFAGL